MSKEYLKFKICFLYLILVVNLFCMCFCAFSVEYDKKGREISEVIKPTAEKKPDENEISDALRKNVDVNSKGNDISKNIISSKIINNQDVATSSLIRTPYTIIRHTNSIVDLDAFRYETEVIHDPVHLRIRLKIKEPSIGEWYAKNGFYKLNGKTYFFDTEGLMVLGNAIDNMGCEYYFLPETGELLEGY